MKVNSLLIFVAVLVGVITLRPSQAGETAVVNADRVNVRSSPSARSEVFAQLTKGETVFVQEKIAANKTDLGAPASWSRIYVPATVPVYVNAAFVNKGIITANQLNVRSGPGEQFSVLARLARGTKVVSISEKLGWLQIKAPPETVAYVATGFLSPIQPQPIPSPAPPEAKPAVVILAKAETLPLVAPSKPEPTVVVVAKTETTVETIVASNIVPIAIAPTTVDASTEQIKTVIDVRVTTRILRKEPSEKLNRFGIAYRAGYNFNASIKGMAPFRSGFNLDPSIARGVDREYDDGFVEVDSSGNAGGLTWKWGYLDPSQISSDGEWLYEHIFSGEPDSAVRKLHGDDPQTGIELTYNRQFEQLANLTNTPWGFLAGISQTRFGVSDRQSLSATLHATTDAYALGGITPPSAPFLPCCETPGIPLIDDLPHRTFSTVPHGASISGHRNFDADIYGLRLGPYVQLPIGDHLSLSASMGLALGLIESEFSYDNTLEIPNSSARLNQSHRSSDSGILAGWYADLQLLVPVYKALKATVGFQYQSLGSYQHTTDFDRVEMDLGQTHFFTIGLSYSF